MKKRTAYLILSAVFLIVLIGTGVYKTLNVKMQPAYCQELYKELNCTSGQFECTSVSANEENIQFVFNLEDLDAYDHWMCTEEMIRIRNQVSEYLSAHPQHDLSEKRIVLQFQTRPGDVASISNYSTKKAGLYNDFPFCLDIRIPISEYESFVNAYSLSVQIEDKGDLPLLGEFKQLEYLNLIVPQLTEEEIAYVQNLLQDCTIVCNGSEITTSKSAAPPSVADFVDFCLLFSF